MSSNPCYCGSAKTYSECCALFHDDTQRPATAEALMRSRYSAFVLKLENYVLATWEKSSRPKRADLTNSQTEWQGLEIIDCKKGRAGDSKGIVEFKAYYRLDGKDFTMHEVSRFSKLQGQWFYLDGVIKSIAKPGQQTNFGLNAPCSCGSGKKYKRCCGT
jgi:SEC-C motif-containing protein